MRITLLESYYGGSHKTWADGYQRFSQHDIELITMPAQYWEMAHARRGHYFRPAAGFQA